MKIYKIMQNFFNTHKCEYFSTTVEAGISIMLRCDDYNDRKLYYNQFSIIEYDDTNEIAFLNFNRVKNGNITYNEFFLIINSFMDLFPTIKTQFIY